MKRIRLQQPHTVGQTSPENKYEPKVIGEKPSQNSAPEVDEAVFDGKHMESRRKGRGRPPKNGVTEAEPRGVWF